MSAPSRFDSALATYEKAAHVQRFVVGELTKALFDVSSHTAKQFKKVFEFGCGTGLLTRSLLTHVTPQTLWLNDASDAMLNACRQSISETINVRPLPGNAETLGWPDNLDLITSSNTVQWFDHPLSVIEKAYRALRVNGVLALSGFLPRTLEEVTSLTGVGLAYPDVNEWKKALSLFFTIDSFEVLPQTLLFESPRAVLKHLRATGVNGVMSHFAWTRLSLRAFCENYEQRFSTEDDRVQLTYIAFVTVAHKHELLRGGSINS